MRNDIYGHIGLVIFLFLVFMWILYHVMVGNFIFAPNATALLKFISALIVEVFLAISEPKIKSQRAVVK